MSKIKSIVMTMANRLFKAGMSRSTAMKKAWLLAKANTFGAKVTGVTFGSRQNALQKLTEAGGTISITLKREPNNSHDKNAVAVYAVASSRQVFFIGYLKKALAFILAPLMDKGEQPQVKSFAVVGGYYDFMNYGMRLKLAV